MKPIRLIIFPGNYLPHVGGLETHVDEFAKYYARGDDRLVTIFAPNINSEGDWVEVKYNNVQIMRYPAFELIKNFPFPNFFHPRFWTSYFSLYKQDYSLVMTRTRFFSNSLLGYVFAKWRFSQKPLIHVEHGSSFVELSSKWKTKLAKFYDHVFGSLIFSSADSVISISTAVDTFIKKAFKVKRSKISLIRRGLDLDIRKTTTVDTKLKEKYKGKIILCSSSRLYKWKGLDKAIKAFKGLPDKVRDKAVFVLVGDGEEREALEKLAGSFKDESIFFLGRLPHEKAFSVIKTADIYVHSSNPGGGLSSAVLDAMYLDCAVLASPHEGAREVFAGSDSGYLLASNSIENLSSGMEELIESSSLRSSLRKKAKRQVQQDFDWKNKVKAYDKVFERLIKNN